MKLNTAWCFFDPYSAALLHGSATLARRRPHPLSRANIGAQCWRSRIIYLLFMYLQSTFLPTTFNLTRGHKTGSSIYPMYYQ